MLICSALQRPGTPEDTADARGRGLHGLPLLNGRRAAGWTWHLSARGEDNPLARLMRVLVGQRAITGLPAIVDLAHSFAAKILSSCFGLGACIEAGLLQQLMRPDRLDGG